MEQPVVRQRQDLRRVDHARLQELVRQGAVQTGRRLIERVALQQGGADEREAVRVQPAGGEPHQHVAVPHAFRPEQTGLVHRADAEPRQIELVVGHDAGVLGRLAAQQRAAGAPASLGHAFHDRGHALRRDLADRQVVQEEQRLGAGAHDVVRAHRDQVDADRVQPPGQPRDLELRADAVGGGGEHASPTDAEQPREPADLVGHLGSPRARGQIGDQRDGLGGGLGVDPGPAVRVAHRAFTGSEAATALPARTSRPAPGSRPDTPRRSTPGRSRTSASPPPGPGRRATGSRASRPPGTR